MLFNVNVVDRRRSSTPICAELADSGQTGTLLGGDGCDTVAGLETRPGRRRMTAIDARRTSA